MISKNLDHLDHFMVFEGHQQEKGTTLETGTPPINALYNCSSFYMVFLRCFISVVFLVFTVFWQGFIVVSPFLICELIAYFLLVLLKHPLFKYIQVLKGGLWWPEG